MNFKLLLVEDDPNYETIVRRLLEPYHGPGEYISQIHAASTMEQALVELTLNNFDLIILDLGLPDSTRQQTMDAIPVIRDRQPDAAVLVVTGSFDAKDESLRRGANAFLDKHLSAQDRAMITAVRAAMFDRHASPKTNAELVERIATT